jgi:hypothetical protein
MYQPSILEHVPTVNSIKKALLNRKFALALYTTSKSFSTFEDPTWTDFFKKLGYVPPTRQSLAKPLLNSVYKETKEKVKEVARGSDIGLVTDELTDVSLNRLANYSIVLLDGTSFYWKTVDVHKQTQDAVHIAEGAIQVGKEVTSSQLKRIISFATNTCPTNQNV